MIGFHVTVKNVRDVFLRHSVCMYLRTLWAIKRCRFYYETLANFNNLWRATSKRNWTQVTAVVLPTSP